MLLIFVLLFPIVGPESATKPEIMSSALQRSISSSNLEQVARIKQRILDDRKPAPAVDAVPYFDIFTAFSFVIPFSELDREHHSVQDAIFEGVLDRGMQKRLEVEEKLINWHPGCVNLSCLKTLGDGNCLMHSASLAMWGIHDRDLILRSVVYTALTHSRSRVLFERWQSDRRKEMSQINASMDVHVWEAEYQQTVDMVNPRRHSGRMDSLTDFHIFVLANVLRRPIIVYSTSRVQSMATGSSFGPNNIPGIYIPLLWNRDCISKDPIALAYAGSHFSALVPGDRHDRNYPPAIPLCDRRGRILPVKFLLPNEANVEDVLRDDYISTTTIRTSSGSIPVAQVNLDNQPEFLKQFWKNHIERKKKSAHYDNSSQPPPRDFNPDLHRAPSYDTATGSGSLKCVQCNTPGAHANTSYLCKECYRNQLEAAGIRNSGGSGGLPPPRNTYERQVSSPDSLPPPITTMHPQAKPKDPYNVEPHREERAAEKCKNLDCGLYGSHEKRGYCSKCYSEIRGGPNQQQRRDYPTCPQCHRNEGVEAYGNLCGTCHSQNMHGQPVYNPKIETSQGSGTLQYGEYDRTHYGREDPPGRGADVRGVKTCSVGGCGKPTDPGGDGTMCLDHFYNKRLASSKKCVFGNCGRATDPASGGKLCFDHFTKALDGKLPGFDLSQITSEQEENLPVNKTGSSRPGVGSYNTEGTRSYGEISGNDLPPPITNNPKPMPRKNIPSQSSYAASTKPDHLAPGIDRIEISPRDMDILSTQKCFLCIDKEPQDSPYGVFVCTRHAREMHKTRIHSPRGMILYLYHSTNLHTYVHTCVFQFLCLMYNVYMHIHMYICT